MRRLGASNETFFIISCQRDACRELVLLLVQHSEIRVLSQNLQNMRVSGLG